MSEIKKMTKAQEDFIEAGCRSVYGRNWDAPEVEKRPGEEMKKVWRELVMKAQAPVLAALTQEEPAPSPGLLMSMALRFDHAIGIPGFYDQTPFGIGKPGGDVGVHARRLQNTLRTMQQLWEEVVGQGFYSPEREEEYIAWQERVLSHKIAEEPERG